MCLPIRLFSDPILHRPCEPVTDINSDIRKLVGEMLVTMEEHHGIGLAANQVGVNKRILVAKLEDQTRSVILINPVITKYLKKKITMNEGCLSAPKIIVPMKRRKAIIVKGLNLDGFEITYEMTEMDARIIQHEMDHLNGYVITDFKITLSKGDQK